MTYCKNLKSIHFVGNVMVDHLRQKMCRSSFLMLWKSPFVDNIVGIYNFTQHSIHTKKDIWWCEDLETQGGAAALYAFKGAASHMVF